MEISLIPRSPCSLGEQIFLQITQDIFFLPSSQPHKKLLCNLNILTIPSGTLKKDKKNKGKKASTKLFKLILLAKERRLCFQIASFFLNFDNRLLCFRPPRIGPNIQALLLYLLALLFNLFSIFSFMLHVGELFCFILCGVFFYLLGAWFFSYVNTCIAFQFHATMA